MKERLTSARLKKLHGHRVSFGTGKADDGIVAIGLLVGYDDATVTVLERGKRVIEPRRTIGQWFDLDSEEHAKLDATLRKDGFNDDGID